LMVVERESRDLAETREGLVGDYDRRQPSD